MGIDVLVETGAGQRPATKITVQEIPSEPKKITGKDRPGVSGSRSAGSNLNKKSPDEDKAYGGRRTGKGSGESQGREDEYGGADAKRKKEENGSTKRLATERSKRPVQVGEEGKCSAHARRNGKGKG